MAASVGRTASPTGLGVPVGHWGPRPRRGWCWGIGLSLLIMTWPMAWAVEPPTAQEEAAEQLQVEQLDPQQQVDLEPPAEQAVGDADARELPESFGLLRPIRFFRGQATGVLPSSFRPITIDQLDERLEPLAKAAAAESSRPQLVRATYLAHLDGTSLVSSQTHWDVSHSGDEPARLLLGQLGLAIGSIAHSAGWPSGTPTDAYPIETDSDGNVALTVRGDARLAVAWTAAGDQIDSRIAFDLSIPRAMQGRMLIEVPERWVLEALDGVGQQLSSPPPEAQGRSSRGMQWYSVEVGGLSRVRLQLSPRDDDQRDRQLIVRRAAMRYELRPASIRMTADWLIDLPRDRGLPTMRLLGARVRSISIGELPVRWSEAADGAATTIRLQRLQRDGNAAGPLALRVEAETSWDELGELQSLPDLELVDVDVLLVGDRVSTEVNVAPRLRLVDMVLPPDWRYGDRAASDDDQRLTYRASGPWGRSSPRVRVLPERNQWRADSIFFLSAAEAGIVMVMETSAHSDALGPRPLRLQVGPDWTVDSVVLAESGRAVDVPPDLAAVGTITIWPTADEVIAGELKFRLVAHRALPVDGNTVTYPAMPLVTMADAQHRCAAVVTPPEGFGWPAETTLSSQLIKRERLSPRQREMLSALPTDALLLEASHGRIDALQSRRAAATFNASCRVELTMDDQWLQQRFEIRCESSSGPLDRVRVEFGAPSVGEIQWSVNEQATAAGRLLRARRVPTAVSGDDASPREIWDLELESTGQRRIALVGRRRRPLPPSAGSDDPARAVRIELPSVVGADGHTTRVLLDDALRLTAASEGVLRVPDAARDPGQRTALRYDLAGASWIELAAIQVADPPPMLWDERVDILASHRGGDWIEATYVLDPGTTLRVRPTEQLQLVDVVDQQGRSLAYELRRQALSVTAPRSRPGTPSGATVSVTIRWVRDARPAGWTRRWQPPQLATNGIALRRQWQLVPAVDTVIVGAAVGRLDPTFLARQLRLLSGQSPALPPADQLASSSSPPLRLARPEDQSLLMVDRSVWLGAIVVVGLLVFAASWALVRRIPALVGIAFLVSVAAVPIVMLDGLHWVTATCIPIAAGGLLGTTLLAAGRWRSSSESGSTGSSRLLASGAVVLLVLLTAAGIAVADEPPAEAEAAWQGNPIVMVPVDPLGRLSGDKVYIPQTLYDHLFRESPVPDRPPPIISAVYRLRLDGMTEMGMPTAQWDIRYSLPPLPERAEIVLPVRPASLRSVQWLPGGEAKPLRWSAEGPQEVRVALPPTDSAALLLRLATDVEMLEDHLCRVALDVPAVAIANLEVESDAPVQRFELSAALGKTVAQPDMRRFDADLGPVRQIQLDVALRRSGRSTPQIESRRYWVHAGPDRAEVECEVALAGPSVRRGAEVTLNVSGREEPILTTDQWSLERSELASPRRRTLGLRALTSQPEPIRMLWSVEPTPDADEIQFSIPEVTAPGSGSIPEAVVAVDAADGYRVTAPTGAVLLDAADAARADASRWQGYRGESSQLMQMPSPLPPLSLQRRSARQWQYEHQHHLHIRASDMLLTYTATITAGDRAIGPLRLVLPGRCQVRELTVNDQPIPLTSSSSGAVGEALLGTPGEGQRLTVRLVASQSLLMTEPFSPPRVQIPVLPTTAGIYSMTRDSGIRVEQVRSSPLIELDQPPMDAGRQLLSGWIPCWTWQLPDAVSEADQADPPLVMPGSFRAEPRTSRVEVVQRTEIRWQQERWRLDALIHLRLAASNDSDDGLLDDVHVELPADWANQLEIDSAAAWLSQPSSDPAFRVVRIRLTDEARQNAATTLRLHSDRTAEAESLVEIPRLRVLDTAETQTYLVAPQVAGGRTLRWKTLAVVNSELPPVLRGLADDDTAPEAPAPEDAPLVFRAVDQAASVQLQPQRSELSEARAYSADVQLFPFANGDTVAQMRWEIEPGDSDQLTIEFPAGAVPLAVRVAGRLIPSIDSSGEAAAVDIPLALSGLAQPVQVLCSLPGVADRPLELPRLDGVEVERTWMAILGPSDGRQPGSRVAEFEGTPWRVSTAPQRLVDLAEAVLEVTRASVDGATDRPRGELIAWLAIWDDRLQQLWRRSWLADQRLDPGDDSVDLVEPGVDEVVQADSEDAAADVGQQRRWQALRRNWQQYTGRLGGEAPLPPWDISEQPPSVWQVETAAWLPGAAARLPPLKPLADRELPARWIRGAISGAIFLGGCLLLLRLRARLAILAGYPPVWLFVLGLSSLVILPQPVAITICIVALLGPWLAPRGGPVPGRPGPAQAAGSPPNSAPH